MVRLTLMIVLSMAGCAQLTVREHLARGQIAQACERALKDGTLRERLEVARALRTDQLKIGLHLLSAEEVRGLLGVDAAPGLGLVLLRLERARDGLGDVSARIELRRKADSRTFVGSRTAARYRELVGLPTEAEERKAERTQEAQRHVPTPGFKALARGMLADLVWLGTVGTVNLNAKDCRESLGVTCVGGKVIKGTIAVARTIKDNIQRPGPQSAPAAAEVRARRAAYTLLFDRAVTCELGKRPTCEMLHVLPYEPRQEASDGPITLRLALEYSLVGAGCYRMSETIVVELPAGETVEARFNALTPGGPRALSELPHTQDVGVDGFLDAP
jgi:hypothetical protein